MSIYRPQQSCGQGNIFAPVCHSVHTGGFCLNACWDTNHPPPGIRHHPPTGPGRPPQTRQTPPDQTPPRTRQTPPLDQTPHPPGPCRLPQDQTPLPSWELTPAYGLRAAGTYPTGMHSCYFLYGWSYIEVMCISV